MKSITSDLAKRIGRDKKATETLLQALGQALRRHCGELDTVAIPSFGNFVAVKHREQIVVDHASGSRLLLPPEVELTFCPGGKLRKLANRNLED
ncbi:MAG: HU family DNA-binding protein [Bacteroidales bacterium]|nr:HU family DNA-binding protein [Bacteroidales bacterium]